jgi:opacity protein-like surface antigen
MVEKRKLIGCMTLLWVSVNVQATEVNQLNSSQHSSRFVVTVSGGPEWANLGNTQTFYLKSDIQNTYFADNLNQTLGTAELFMGLQRALNTQFTGQLGIAVASGSVARLSGQIWQDADPDYYNFNYTYKIIPFRVAMKGKLIAENNFLTSYIQPYISGSLGAGFNRAFNYQATPTIFQAVVAPGFTPNTSSSFSYTVGAGIQRSLNSNWQVGIGYEFADWGSSSLAAAPGQTLNKGLRLGSLYTNELQFNISYIA